MFNLDSLSLKYLIEENKDFFTGAVIQKIQMLSKREILLSMRNLGENRKLYINVDPKFPHMNFITCKENYFIKIPKEPPMFCMLLRKHLEGAKLSEVRAVDYERIAEFYFNIYDEIGSMVPMCLSVEIMGKHSNVILYNAKSKIIAGCVHNISPEKSSVREVWGGIQYIYPPKQEKSDILRVSASDFYNTETAEISNKYYYFSKGLIDFILKKDLEKIELFSTLQNLVARDNRIIKEFWAEQIKKEGLSVPECGSLNGLIEKYFSYFVMKDLMEIRKNRLSKALKKEYKRQNDVILNSDKRADYLSHKEKGDLILANIYKIKEGDKKFETDGIEIILDENKTPTQNAQSYFALYTKGKKAAEVLEKRKIEALDNIKYLDEILFSIENADRPDILDEIEEELGEYSERLKGQNSANGRKKETLNIQNIEYQGFNIILGKNNKQNDYLIRKLSNPEDIWLHAKDCPSGHIIIKTENGRKPLTDEVLLYAAKLAKENSPMRNNAKASIIYTKRKYLKRPPETHLGYVTYREEKEIVI